MPLLVTQESDANLRWRIALRSSALRSLMSAVLGGLANAEHNLIRTHAADRPSGAMKRDKHMGRKPKFTIYPQQEARRRVKDGEPMLGVARSLNVSHSTISRLAT